MDLSRLTQGEKISLGSGVALLVFMFLFKWFGVSFDTGIEGIGSIGGSVNAWDSMEVIRFVLLITGVAAVAFPLLKASGNELGISMPPATIVTILGGISFLLILYRIIDPPGPSEVGREIGVFLGLIAAAGIVYGGYTGMQEEGTSFQDSADRFSGPGDSRGSDSPPPPPPGNPQG